MTDRDGKDRIHETKTIVAGNEYVHRQLLETLQKAQG